MGLYGTSSNTNQNMNSMSKKYESLLNNNSKKKQLSGNSNNKTKHIRTEGESQKDQYIYPMSSSYYPTSKNPTISNVKDVNTANGGTKVNGTN